MTGTDCGLFTYKSVPVIFEPPCMLRLIQDMILKEALIKEYKDV
jgi:hypothetical protein